jgi:hypothetical protein
MNCDLSELLYEEHVIRDFIQVRTTHPAAKPYFDKSPIQRQLVKWRLSGQFANHLTHGCCG